MDIPSNAREIQPVSLWNNGTLVTVDYLTLDNYVQYDFKGNNGQVYYSLNSINEISDSDGNSMTIVKPFASGAIQLTDSVVSSWGASDQPIFDFVASQLNLILV